MKMLCLNQDGDILRGVWEYPSIYLYFSESAIHVGKGLQSSLEEIPDMLYLQRPSAQELEGIQVYFLELFKIVMLPFYDGVSSPLNHSK